MHLQVGDLAPDFELVNHNGETIRLSAALSESAVVLVFYPFAFSGVCTGELCELRDNIAAFESADARLFGISVDSKFTLKKWAEQEGYTFDLLADFWPHGEVARSYGVFLEDRGIANRATFVIGQDGRIASAIVTNPGEARDFAAYTEALAQL